MVIVTGNGLHNCTSCTPPMVLLGHYCVAQCPSHWVLSPVGQKCGRCHPSCRTCSGTAADDCLSCTDSQMSLDGSTCRAECPAGQFAQQDTRRCDECHPTCQTCSGAGPSSCISCVDGLVKIPGNTCHSVCPVGKFSSNGDCIDCHSSCKTCNSGGQDSCLSCPENSFHFHGSCVSNCPVGTYPDIGPDSGHCGKCHPVCQSCSGSSSSSCTTCKAPFFLENSNCVPQCSKGFSNQKGSKTCTPCGTQCKVTQNRFKHQSAQDPSTETLDFVLKDPKESGVLTIAIVGIAVAVLAFFAIFGVLQMRSTNMLCWGHRYTILKANFERRDEEVHLMGQAKDDQEDCAWSECYFTAVSSEQPKIFLFL